MGKLKTYKIRGHAQNGCNRRIDDGIQFKMAQLLQTAQERLSATSGDVLGSDHKFPAFDELPKVEGMPQGSIWGFYDKDGKKDEVGCPSRSPAQTLPRGIRS